MVPIVAGAVASQSERQLRAMVQSIIEPSWIEYVFEPLTEADHRRAAALLDVLVDLLVESGIGVTPLPILADDPADWSRKRRLRASINESYFELSVNPDGGINLLVSFEDADSTDRCNTLGKSLCRCFILQCFSRALVELPRDGAEFGLAVGGHVEAPGKVLAQGAVGVLVAASLPRRLRVAEVDVDLRGHGERHMIGHL